MATDSLRLSTEVPAAPEAVYKAWLSARGHAAITGSNATVEPRVGGRHSAHDGYIHGFTLALAPGKRIVQSWRTTEFPPEAPDSLLEVRVARAGGGTRVTLIHTDIPEGQGARYREGWEQFYFAPMQAYFAQAAKPAKRAKPAKTAKAKSAKTAKAKPRKK